MTSILGLLSREGGPEEARAVLGKTAVVTPGSQERGLVLCSQLSLSSDVIMEGLVFVLIRHSHRAALPGVHIP